MTKHFSQFAIVLATLAVVAGNRDASAGLVAHYDFETGFNDLSGNGHTGTPSGDTPPVRTDDPTKGWALDLTGTSANAFLNIDSTVAIPDFPAETSITLAAWVKRTAGEAGAFRYVINLGADGDNAITTLGVRQDGSIASYAETDQPGGNLDQVNTFGTTLIEDSAATWTDWHHLAVVYDRSTDVATVYLDGKVDGTNSIVPLQDTFAQSWVGAGIGRGSNASNRLQALIDDVYIYDHALTAAEIRSLVPEPSGIALALLAGLGLHGWSRRRI